MSEDQILSNTRFRLARCIVKRSSDFVSKLEALEAKVIALAGDEGKATLMRRDIDVDSVMVMESDWI